VDWLTLPVIDGGYSPIASRIVSLQGLPEKLSRNIALRALKIVNMSLQFRISTGLACSH
jgi:hypothetical protein